MTRILNRRSRQVAQALRPADGHVHARLAVQLASPGPVATSLAPAPRRAGGAVPAAHGGRAQGSPGCEDPMVAVGRAAAEGGLHMQVRRPDIARGLLARVDAARANWRTPAYLLRTSPEELPYARDIDYVNARVLRRIVGAQGWPGLSMVGVDACLAAVDIAVHADHAPGLQRTLLRMLHAAANQGEATWAQWAHLYDRCLAGEGQRQVYGTQYRYVGGGHLELCPVEDLEGVDERRHAIGLAPLAEQGARLRLHHTGALTGSEPAAPTLASAGIGGVG